MLYDATNPRWQHLLNLAHRQWIRVERIDDGTNQDRQLWHSICSADSAILGEYRQELIAGPGGIEIWCSCDARGACKHLAAVLEAEGHLVADADAPEPTPLRRKPVVLGGRELSGRECLAILNGSDD